MQGIGSRQALIEQAAYDWIGGGTGVFDDPRAIDDLSDLHASYLVLPAPPVTNQRSVRVRFYPDHFCRYQRETSGRDRLRDARLDLGRHAMTVHIPPGARMFKEVTFGCQLEIPPEPLGEGSDSIDHTAPVAALRDVRIDPMAEPAQQPARVGPKWDIRFLDPRWVYATMRHRQEAAARYCYDRPFVSVAQQRQHVIDHC